MNLNKLMSTVCLMVVAALVGCAGRAELIPNDDKALQRTAAEFAADAAKRHPYKAAADRGGVAKARAEIGYVWDRIDIANHSDSMWTDVEVWVNGEYVVYLPKLEPHKIKSLAFQMLYNGTGQSFPTSNGGWLNRKPVLIQKIEIFRDGKLYDVPFQSAE